MILLPLAGQVLKSALEQPFRILLENAGMNADEWLPQVRKGKAGQGVDVNNPAKLVDLKVAGIVDPARVPKKLSKMPPQLPEQL
jgi:chaperonin GroEL (HSP60 family)